MQDSLRARRRQFIRTHHPDHGGDPTTFITGLAALHDDNNNDHDDGERAPVSAYRRGPAWRRPLSVVRRRLHPTPSRVR